MDVTSGWPFENSDVSDPLGVFDERERVYMLRAFFSPTLASSPVRLVPALLLRSAADAGGGDHVALARLR